jgi:hypothetical protein
MGKIAGGGDHAIHRLLPHVKKKIKLEMKECKSLTIPHLDQKKADIAAGKRHPKAKGKGKGPKSSRETATVVKCAENEVQEGAEGGNCAEGFLNATESMKSMVLEHMNTLYQAGDEEMENEEMIGSERADEGKPKKSGTPMSSQGSATDVDREEIVVREDFQEGNYTEQVPETSEGKKRKRGNSANAVLKAKENAGMAAGEAGDESAVPRASIGCTSMPA